MAAPSHKVFWLPLKLLMSDGTEREWEAFVRQHDAPNVPTPAPAFEITQDVISIQTDKVFHLSPGRFSIDMVDARRGGPTKAPLMYTQVIQPNDLIAVYLNGGEQNDPDICVMLGVVVRIGKVTRVADERVTHVVEIAGQDCARWLYTNQNNFWAYSGVGAEARDGIRELQQRLNIWEFLFPNKLQSDLPSTKILESILTGYIGRISRRVGELFRYQPIPTRSTEAKLAAEEPILGFGERYIPEKSLAAYSGPVANLLLDHVLECLSELWSDTTDEGGFSIFYRRPPFDQSDWASFSDREPLPTRALHVIGDDEIVSVDLGRSDEQFYNFISVISWIYGADSSVTRLVLNDGLRLDVSSIQDRGLRPLYATPKYLDYFSQNESSLLIPQGTYDELIKGDNQIETVSPNRLPATQLPGTLNQVMANKNTRMVRLLADWGDALWRWHSREDQYFAGSITIKGHPEIRVGHKIELTSETGKHFTEPYEFYVNSVRQSYDLSTSYLTTVGLRRGQPKAPEKFIRPVTDGKEDFAAANAQKRQGTFVNKRPLTNEPFRELQVERMKVGGIVTIGKPE